MRTLHRKTRIRIHTSTILGSLLFAAGGCSSTNEIATVDAGTPDVAAGDAAGAAPLERSHMIVADQYNNRVVEIDEKGMVVWTFGDGSATPGAHSVVGPNDAERLPSGDTLISGTGVPGGTNDVACKDKMGCTDDRVLLVDAQGQIKFSFGGAHGAVRSPLSAPVSARALENGNLLIVDQGNNRVVEITMGSSPTEVWQFPALMVVPLDSPLKLSSPNSAERLANGHTLIADEGANRVIEVTSDSAPKIVWQYPEKPAQGKNDVLDGPAFASRLADGHTLISDSNNNRIIEIDDASPAKVVWTYDTTVQGRGVKDPTPTRAVRLKNGDTLISDQNNDRVLVVDMQKNVVFSYGMIGKFGDKAGELNGPYDAKIVGDFTGLSQPPASSL